MPTTSSQFIYLGNFADFDTNESSYRIEDPSDIYRTFSNNEMSVVNVVQTDANGDRQLQTDNAGQAPDTFTYDVGSGSQTSGLDSAGRFFVDFTDENGTPGSTVASVYQTDNGDVFLKLPNGLQVSSVTITGKRSDGYSSITYGTSSSATVVCFSSGVLIKTASGPRAVEELKVGDTVATLDRGDQTIRWIRRSDHFLGSGEPDDKPILISAGALGPGRPSRDLIVSPHHRLLVGGWQQLAGSFDAEVFAPAKALVDLPGVRRMHGKKRVTWVHFSCDYHEIVFANGCLTETLLLGPMVLNALSPTSQQILADMYSAPARPNAPLNGPAARECLTVGQVRRQLKARYRAIIPERRTPTWGHVPCASKAGQAQPVSN